MNNVKPAAPSALAFARFAGEMAEAFSFNRSLGQIYGLLYLSEEPLSLEEIARTLSMSKGGASVNVRTLESWGAVRPVSVDGSRKDYYAAETDIKALVLRRLGEGMGKRLEMAQSRLDGLLAQSNGKSDALRKREKDLRGMLDLARKGISLMKKVGGFL
jgi:DNA-binding transcriptional regulator GbsR (MarR family)